MVRIVLSRHVDEPNLASDAVTIARQVVAGTTHLITRRCTQRQLLLRPDPLVEQIYLYCLGDAVERHGISLHGFVAMSNHHHVVVRDNHGNFPAFLAHLHKMMAKVMNALRGRRENFWATEQPNAVRLVNPSDRFDKLVYLLANPVAGDLVDKVTDWPGASSLHMHLSGETMTVMRPDVFFGPKSTMPDAVTLRLERPDGFEDLSEEDWVAKLEAAVHAAEADARARRNTFQRDVLGREATLRASPTDSPTTVEARCTLRPHLACADEPSRVEALKALAAFRKQRRAALLRFLNGERDVEFPIGTYRIGRLLVPPAKQEPSAQAA